MTSAAVAFRTSIRAVKWSEREVWLLSARHRSGFRGGSVVVSQALRASDIVGRQHADEALGGPWNAALFILLEASVCPLEEGGLHDSATEN
jgi:hypothetical protein